MDTENKTFEALAQKPFMVMLGGKEYEFYPMSLSDRQEIAAISSTIPETIQESDESFSDALKLGAYARQVAEIVAVGAHIRGSKIKYFRMFGKNVPVWVQSEKARRQELFEMAYEKASIIEIFNAIKDIFIHSNPAFFLNIITSLSQKNLLTPTKEI